MRRPESRGRKFQRFRSFSIETLESRVFLASDLAHADLDDHDHGHGEGCSCSACCGTHGLPIETAEMIQQGEATEAALEASGAESLAPLTDTFLLHSNPNANHTIYLDFDGHITTGTTWNNAYGVSTINSPAYDIDGNAASFNNTELQRIQRIWQRVAEDFAPFDVNVTTEDPGAAALSKSGAGDTMWGTRVVITDDTFANCGCGGHAYIGSFNDSVDEPVFVYNTSEIGVSAAASHEVGHALYLSHDGLSSGASYYNGHGANGTEEEWGPIMGSGYYANMTTWDNGTYFNSNNGGSGANYNRGPNDLQVITTYNGFGYRSDDHGDTLGSSSALGIVGTNGSDPTLLDVDSFGIVSQPNDVDVFSFTTGAGLINLTIDSYVAQTFVSQGGGSYSVSYESTPLNNQGSNLDVLATIYNSSGAVVATSNPAGLSASFNNLSLAAGTYYVSIDGTGFGDWTANPPTGYSNYVSLGQYRVIGTVVDDSTPNNPPVANNDSASVDENSSVNINVLTNDSDPDSDPLIVTSVTQGSSGSVVIETDSTVTYTPIANFSGADSFTYTISDGRGGVDTATVNVTVDPVVPADPKIVTGVLADVGTADWTTVTLGQAYDSMIVVATPVHIAGNAPLVTRISNVTGNSFDIQVQRVDGGTGDLTGIQVQYLAVDAGVYTLSEHGITMEAVKFTSTVTDRKGSWTGEQRTYANSYASPVVLGQVMSSNDADHSVFWSRGSARQSIPNASNLWVGKHVGEDPDTVRADETVGYIVVESGSGAIGGLTYVAAVGADNVRGTQNGSFAYNVTGMSDATSAVLSQTAMDGGDGSWAVLSGVNSVNGSTITLAVDEDTLNDTERAHTTEQVAYLVFNDPAVNTEPDAVDDLATTNEDTAVVINVLSNDSDGDGDTLSIASFTQGAAGTVTDNGDGTLSYTPDVNFNGSDVFAYTISDGNGGTDTATVGVTVNAINDAPVANDDGPLATVRDTTLSNIDVLDNDSDVDGDILSVTSASANNGNVTVNGDGTLDYTPDTGYSGADTITYSISDGNGGTDSATVSIDIAPGDVDDTDLVALWTLDGNASDTSPYGQDNSGTTVGDAIFVSDPDRGQVLRLDGTTDYVDVADSGDINLGIHGQRTVALWFKADEVTTRQVLFEEGGGTRGLVIYVENGLLYVGGWNRTSSQSGWTGTWISTTVTAGQWHNVALTLDGGATVQPDALKGYLNGQLFGAGAGSQLWQHSGDIGIGRNDGATRYHDGNSSTQRAFAGLIDDVRIYNRVLNDSELSTLAGGSSSLSSDSLRSMSAAAVAPHVNRSSESARQLLFAWIATGSPLGQRELRPTVDLPTIDRDDALQRILSPVDALLRQESSELRNFIDLSLDLPTAGRDDHSLEDMPNPVDEFFRQGFGKVRDVIDSSFLVVREQ